MSFISTNPFTGKINAEYPFVSDEEILRKIELSKEIYNKTWRKKSIKERIEHIKDLSTYLLDKKDKLAKTISSEMGKPIKESVAEIEKVVWLIDYYTENAENHLKPKFINAKGYEKSYLRYDSIGGVLGIMPWNYPFWQVYRFAIPTLLAGNTVFLKHAPNVPLCAFEIEKSFNEVTGIEGLFQNLFIDIPQVALVMEHPFVQGVSLTGSDRAGKSIGALAGKNIKRSVLELGGNDPFILLRDADMDKAIEHFVLSRMSNNGQICIAAKRMLVHSDIYDEVKKRLVERISALKIGDPMDMESDITCLARPDLRQNLNEQIKDIRALGANVLFENTDLSGNRCSPVVMEIDRNINFKFDNEIFGPVAVMIKFSDDKELLEIANSSKYGLAASIWSKNIEKAENLAASLDVGNVSVNKLVASDPRIPFGGTKQSGYGREMAEEGIKEFVNVKAIVVA